MDIEVEVPDEASHGLKRDLWMFRADTNSGAGLRIVPHLYLVQNRLSRRHKWSTTKFWGSFSDLVHSYGEPAFNSRMSEHPDITVDIREQVVQRVIASIRWRSKP